MAEDAPAPPLTPAAIAPFPDGMVVGPATRLLWRGPESIQLELGASGVVVEGLSVQAVHRLATRVPPTADAASNPAPPTLAADTRVALAALRDAGYLWPRHPEAADGDDPRLAPPASRLAGELRALQVHHGEEAAQVLAGRHWASVEVEGTHRVAVQVASLLAAAGVGRVRCTAAGRVALAHTAPGGLQPSDEGTARVSAADAALRRAAPEVDTSPGDGAPDLTVLAVDGPLADERRDALHAADAVHLCVSVGLDRGVVGPLVVPGLTSCTRCADLIRTERDPAWNALAVQLATPTRYGQASPVALAAVVAGVAAAQTLAYLDGAEPATVDGTIELVDPDWRLRRRSWGVHPHCGCVDQH